MVQQYSGPFGPRPQSHRFTPLLDMLTDDEMYPFEIDAHEVQQEFLRKCEHNLLKDMPLPYSRSVVMCVGFSDFRVININDEKILQKNVEHTCKSYGRSIRTNEKSDSVKVSGLCNSSLWKSCALVVRKSQIELIQIIVSSIGENGFLKYLASFLLHPEQGLMMTGNHVMHFYITFQNTWCALDFLVGYTQCEFGCSRTSGFFAHRCTWSRDLDTEETQSHAVSFGDYFHALNQELDDQNLADEPLNENGNNWRQFRHRIHRLIDYIHKIEWRFHTSRFTPGIITDPRTNDLIAAGPLLW